MSKTIGKGINIAKAGFGGRLLKSEKKSWNESAESNTAHNNMATVEIVNILLRRVSSQPVLFKVACNPFMIKAIHVRVSNSIRKPGIEKVLFML